MNERIQELKIQACKWASENAPMSEYENACDEKFAELIVRECADFIAETATIETLLGDRLKDHFEVKA